MTYIKLHVPLLNCKFYMASIIVVTIYMLPWEDVENTESMLSHTIY